MKTSQTCAYKLKSYLVSKNKVYNLKEKNRVDNCFSFKLKLLEGEQDSNKNTRKNAFAKGDRMHSPADLRILKATFRKLYFRPG